MRIKKMMKRKNFHTLKPARIVDHSKLLVEELQEKSFVTSFLERNWGKNDSILLGLNIRNRNTARFLRLKEYIM
jgi:hypothetical protein